MASINELYISVYEKLNKIKLKYDDVDGSLRETGEQNEIIRQKRIKNLESQLEKISEYQDKLEYFKRLAEKRLTSKNLLTITPRELNFNRLRNWAMMIDPSEDDDPYAQRVYVQVACNEMFLAQKKSEFEDLLNGLKQADGAYDKEAEQEAAKIKSELSEECKAVIESEEFSRLAKAILDEHAHYEQGLDEGKPCSKVGLGIYAQTLPVLEEAKYAAKAKLGEYFDERGYIFLPAEHSADRDMVISVKYSPDKEKKLYRGIQNYLLEIISRAESEPKKVYFLDALHFNNTALGLLRPVEDSKAIEAIPKNQEAVSDKLREIVSSFSDIDEIIGAADSVRDFNSEADEKQRVGRTTLVLIGYPSAFSEDARRYVKRILLNYTHYGISLILADNQFAEKQGNDSNTVIDSISENIYRVEMNRKETVISQNQGEKHPFKWYELTRELSPQFIEKIKKDAPDAALLSTEYIKRVDMENIPPYSKENGKDINIPYGVDAKGKMHSISFKDENFAAYLMGASGSGKSTLLHTLITGIIRNYHPDNVELWLADFKMSEFAQYINPMPPHIKYILLDESPELVYDLIDKLTDKMMERQRFFMKHRDMKKVENVPSEFYMPIIFVILDEFSIMSQAVADSEQYKLKLQNLLAKGRALGIKFIFSSQTFTKGVAGLTQTAKDQIQTRIAMKNSYNEINETLELSSEIRTEQVKNWMEALPPHFTLSKYRDGDKMRVKRLQVMYFKGKGDEALKPQRNMIEALNRKLHKVDIERYDSKNSESYVDKEPVVVDGNSYRAFDSEEMKNLALKYKSEKSEELSLDDKVIVFGAPRRMANVKFAVISNESRENLLLLARGMEQPCEMSVILTTLKMLEMQGAKISVWAYNKNRLYRTYKESYFANYRVAEGISEICSAIFETKQKILQKEISSEIIVMLGMEQICGDFELIDFKGAPLQKGTSGSKSELEKYEAATEEELLDVDLLKQIQKEFNEKYDMDELEDQWDLEGKTDEEIFKEEKRLFNEFLAERGMTVLSGEGAASTKKDEPLKEEQNQTAMQEENEEEEDKAYDASDDLKYIIKQGSRFGYHFMLCLNDFSDLKATHLSQDLFRHKMAFQLSADDSVALFSSRTASKLPEHVCQYSSSLEQYSFRPFIHEGVSWDGWDIGPDGKATNLADL